MTRRNLVADNGTPLAAPRRRSPRSRLTKIASHIFTTHHKWLLLQICCLRKRAAVPFVITPERKTPAAIPSCCRIGSLQGCIGEAIGS